MRTKFVWIHCALLLLSLGLAPNVSQAEGGAYISLGTAKVRKAVLAFPDIRSQAASSDGMAKTATLTVTNDLLYMDMFTFLGRSAFIEDSTKAGITIDTIKFSDWSTIGAEFLIKASVSLASDQTLTLDGRLYDAVAGKQIFSKQYVAQGKEVKTIAHTFANDIVQTLTGSPGVFLTKIAMTCDLNGKKEIYTVNFDGSEAKQITHHRSIAFAPAWDPSGTRLAYSLYTRHAGNIKNIDLYIFDFTTNSITKISDRKGINSGAAFSPDGQTIAATLSFSGNPEIYLINPNLGTTKQLTRSLGFDVDPSWSPDGKSIAFVSSRTGNPMVFSMNADGSQVQRLTFAGRYNATPAWSPRGNKMAFAGWIDGKFDIFMMNPDGTNIERLTKNQGNNEDPVFSPDGNFIAFSSNRTGQKVVYVMNTAGTFARRLTYGLGNCVSPKWSSPPTPNVSNIQKPTN